MLPATTRLLQELVTNEISSVSGSVSTPEGETFLAAIVGGRQPSRYAGSVHLWNTYARQAGVSLVFVPLDVPQPDGLPQLIRIFGSDPHFVDLTVTDPYKQAAFAGLYEAGVPWSAEPSAHHLRLCNHLIKPASSAHHDEIVRIQPGIKALNTDGRGMVRAISEKLPLAEARALLIGAGGAGASIAQAFLSADTKVHIANAYENETRRTMQLLRRMFPNADQTLTSSDFSAVAAVAAEADVIVNTVPAGCPVRELERIPRGSRPLIAEAPYGERAALQDFASERGLVYVDGGRMLLGQFLCAIELLQPMLCSRTAHERALAAVRRRFVEHGTDR